MKNTKSNMKIEKVDTALLHSGLAYQRTVRDMDRVKYIASNWNNLLFQYPCVSFRDGTYNVIDGQHTIYAFRMRFGKNVQIPCKVAYDLTEEEENEWFAREAEKSATQNSNRIYSSKIASGHDEQLNKLVKDLAQAGLKLKTHGVKGSNAISAIKAIENIYKKMNHIDFINCYSILQKTWNGDNKSLTNQFLNAMHKFYTTYRGKFEEERFIKILGKISPEEIVSQTSRDLYTSDVSLRYARFFAHKYNYRINSSYKLNIGKLDD